MVDQENVKRNLPFVAAKVLQLVITIIVVGIFTDTFIEYGYVMDIRNIHELNLVTSVYVSGMWVFPVLLIGAVTSGDKFIKSPTWLLFSAVLGVLWLSAGAVHVHGVSTAKQFLKEIHQYGIINRLLACSSLAIINGLLCLVELVMGVFLLKKK